MSANQRTDNCIVIGILLSTPLTKGRHFIPNCLVLRRRRVPAPGRTSITARWDALWDISGFLATGGILRTPTCFFTVALSFVSDLVPPYPLFVRFIYFYTNGFKKLQLCFCLILYILCSQYTYHALICLYDRLSITFKYFFSNKVINILLYTSKINAAKQILVS